MRVLVFINSYPNSGGWLKIYTIIEYALSFYLIHNIMNF